MEKSGIVIDKSGSFQKCIRQSELTIRNPHNPETPETPQKTTASSSSLVQLVGLREKLRENPIFHGKIWLVSGEDFPMKVVHPLTGDWWRGAEDCCHRLHQLDSSLPAASRSAWNWCVNLQSLGVQGLERRKKIRWKLLFDAVFREMINVLDQTFRSSRSIISRFLDISYYLMPNLILSQLPLYPFPTFPTLSPGLGPAQCGAFSPRLPYHLRPSRARPEKSRCFWLKISPEDYLKFFWFFQAFIDINRYQ